MKSAAMIFLTAAVLLSAAVPAGAVGEDLSGPSPVDLTADELTYDRPTATYQASGGVHLTKGNLTLLADQVRFNAETEEASAAGNVRLTDPEAQVEADVMELNLGSGRGRLHAGRLLVYQQGYRVGGELIERLGETDYRIEDGTFTTCEGEVPTWKFGARRLDVTVGGYARARHALFYLHDVPVLYFPYFFYPVKTERESGFLTPRVGSSSRRGTQFSLAWYQVIARNQDATFSLDYLSKLGIGKGLEYRYIFGTEDEGDLNLYHISGMEEGETRYAVDWEHFGRLPGDVRLTADVQWVSSRDYFEDFGEVAGEYNREEAQSVVALSRQWQRRYNLTGQLKYIKDLEGDSDTTLQKLPEVAFAAIRQPFGKSPFFFALDASAVHFERDEGTAGERLTVRPELSAVFHPGDIVDVQPWIGYRQRLYRLSGDGSEGEGSVDLGARVSSRFERVFDVGGRRVKKILHMVEPEILYTYAPAEDGDLPFFDAQDDVGPVNRVGYALVNRLTARLEEDGGAPLYHEFLYFRLSQDYDIRESRPGLLDPAGRREPFSDIAAELLVRPHRWSYLDLETRFDVESAREDFIDRFTLFNARGGVHDGGGNGISLEYRYQRDQTNYLTATADVAWLRPVYLNYLHRHDFSAGRTLEKVLNLEYRAQCWSLFLTLRDRLEDTEFLVSFALTGLGRVGGMGGSLGGGDR